MKPRFENKIAEGKRTDGVDFMIHKWGTFYPDFVAIIRGVTRTIEQIIVEYFQSDERKSKCFI